MDHLQSMKVFVRVADLGSFARAAGAMDISNAVATRHIADLEGRLGTRLLNRTTRSLSLTESGQVYLERARQILDELEDVEQMVVARSHEPVGSLRIVAPVVFGLHNLAPVLQTYAERYPKVVPDVTLVDRQVDLVEEGFDVGIVIARQMRSASIVTRRLTTGCLTVCATPAYLEKHGVPARPEDLADHPSLSLPSEYFGDERVFTGPEGEVHVRPTNVIVANNTEMLRQFALLGMGIAILPSYLIGNDTTRGKLVRLLGDYRLPQVEINVAYPSRRHLPAKVRTFIDHLVEYFSKTPNHQLGEQWAKDGALQPGSPVINDDSEPLVAHAAYAEAEGGDRFDSRGVVPAVPAVSADDSRVNGKPVKSRVRSPLSMPSPF